MRSSQHFLLGAASALAAVAVVGLAAGHWRPVHEMTVRLPGGGVERVLYYGDPPSAARLGTDRVESVVAAPAAIAMDPFPFVEMERLSALMDREIALDGPTAGLTALPFGGSRYEMVSAMPGIRSCTRTVEIIGGADGRPPRVSAHASGACGDAGGATSGSGATQTRNAMQGAEIPAPAARDGQGRLLKTSNPIED